MRNRRGHGEGSIYRRKDGQWCASMFVGWDEQGKYQRRVVYGRTKREVREKLARLQAQVLDGLQVKPTRMRVSEYLDHWLEHAARPRLRRSTHDSYKSTIKLHLKPNIGGVRLVQLQPSQVQALYSRLEKDGASPRTRLKAHVVLRCALQQAVKWGYLVRNPCDVVDRPRVAQKPMRYLDPDQAKRFLEKAREERLYPLYVLGVTTGMRLGELFGLQWKDVDWESGALTVQRSLQELSGGAVEINAPKTAKGRRRVSLTTKALGALREHRKQMLADGHRSKWVFYDSRGGALRRSNFTRRSFKPLLQKAKLPDIRFHDLRHTAATLLLSQGVHPKVVQEMLGHATIVITLDTYSHVLPSMQQEAVAKLDELLGR